MSTTTALYLNMVSVASNAGAPAQRIEVAARKFEFVVPAFMPLAKPAPIAAK